MLFLAYAAGSRRSSQLELTHQFLQTCCRCTHFAGGTCRLLLRRRRVLLRYRVNLLQTNAKEEFVALPTRKYARRCMTADIQYSIAFYMNPMYPCCLPEWCDMAIPISEDASSTIKEEEGRKLLGSINKYPIELFPYFGDTDANNFYGKLYSCLAPVYLGCRMFRFSP